MQLVCTYYFRQPSFWILLERRMHISYYKSSNVCLSVCLSVCSLSPPRSFDGSSPNLVGACRWTSELPLRSSFSKRSTGQWVNGSLLLSTILYMRQPYATQLQKVPFALLLLHLKKTEVLHQPAPQNEYHAPHISTGETVLKSVEQLTYLGCAISSNARIDGEIDNRLAKANSTFGRLYNHVWNNKHLRIITKISVYRAVVLTTLLYGSESWVTYRNHLNLLERFHQRCLRTILNIHWSDYITNIIVLEQADITSIEAMLLKIQLRWAGHVARTEDHRLPKIILYGELSSGLRNRGAQKKRYKDILKKSLGACNISHLEWTTPAEDRGTWRRTISKAASSFESSRRSAIEEKRQRRKNSAAITPNPNETFTCCHCNRTCRSRIGLISHERACRKRGLPQLDLR